MKWGELKEGDVIVDGPLEGWRHAWLVVSTAPDPDHEACALIEIVDLDTLDKTTHSRVGSQQMAEFLGYDVLRGRELVKAGG